LRLRWYEERADGFAYLPGDLIFVKEKNPREILEKSNR
jgi:hypothetical protein